MFCVCATRHLVYCFACRLLRTQDDLDGKELTNEIAGLEGLMKDLNAISQRQYDS
jgi:hypothetical protein